MYSTIVCTTMYSTYCLVASALIPNTNNVFVVKTKHCFEHVNNVNYSSALYTQSEVTCALSSV